MKLPLRGTGAAGSCQTQPRAEDFRTASYHSRVEVFEDLRPGIGE